MNYAEHFPIEDLTTHSFTRVERLALWHVRVCVCFLYNSQSNVGGNPLCCHGKNSILPHQRDARLPGKVTSGLHINVEPLLGGDALMRRRKKRSDATATKQLFIITSCFAFIYTFLILITINKWAGRARQKKKKKNWKKPAVSSESSGNYSLCKGVSNSKLAIVLSPSASGLHVKSSLLKRAPSTPPFYSQTPPTPPPSSCSWCSPNP